MGSAWLAGWLGRGGETAAASFVRKKLRWQQQWTGAAAATRGMCVVEEKEGREL